MLRSMLLSGSSSFARIATLIALVVGCLAPSSCAVFNRQPVERKEIVSLPQEVERPYSIGRDDEIEVIVWKQPQLSGKVKVGSDGTITMPLIDRVPAAGKTPMQLKEDLVRLYSRYLHDPNVTVRVTDTASRVFYVIGEVKKPGVFNLHSGEVLSQAIAEAGGFAEFADPSKIRILRREPGQMVELRVNYNAVSSGRDLLADVRIEPGDTVTVP